MLQKTKIQKLLHSSSLDDVTSALDLLDSMEVTPQNVQELFGVKLNVSGFMNLKESLSNLPHGFYIAVWALFNVVEE